MKRRGFLASFAVAALPGGLLELVRRPLGLTPETGMLEGFAEVGFDLASGPDEAIVAILGETGEILSAARFEEATHAVVSRTTVRTGLTTPAWRRLSDA